jgi:hypothetical protein
MVVLNLGACQVGEPPPRDPMVVGVVERLDFVSGRTADVQLTDGQSIRIDLNAVSQLIGSGPAPGALLIYGDQPTPWLATLVRSSRGSFEVRTEPDDASDGSISLDSGIRLPIADDYRDSDSHQLEAGSGVIYVINDQGEVIARP